MKIEEQQKRIKKWLKNKKEEKELENKYLACKCLKDLYGIAEVTKSTIVTYFEINERNFQNFAY
jgi:hypothetical protein